MTKQENKSPSRSTRRALTSSVLALVLCFVMLLGTTFAWFTDTASTKVNTIESGTLDVELKYAAAWDDNGNPTEWADAEGQTLSFITKDNRGAEKTFWEPGCTYTLPQVKVINKGNLALKYKVVISAATGSLTEEKTAVNLADVIDVYLGETKVGTLTEALTSTDNDGYAWGTLTANTESAPMTISLHMQDLAGNEYQGLSIESIAVTVYAKQDTVEWDSSTNQYDADAGYATCVSNITALREAIAKGEDVVLTSDIILNSGDDLTQYSGKNAMLVISEDTTIDLNGKEFSYTGPHDDAWYGIYVADGATLTIIDSSDDKSGEIYSGNAWAVIVATGTANIYGGNFKALMAPCAYKNAGYINIYGGTFEYLNQDGSAGSGVLNVGDLLLAQYGPIMLYGGTFKNFEPGVTNGSESKVADGYKVESETQSNGDIWYTVVPN